MNPLLIGGGAAALLALLMFGPGTAKAAPADNGRGRAPNMQPIQVVPVQELRAAVCAGAEGRGTILTDPFVADLWSTIYPDLAWPTVPEDHPTILEAEAELRQQVALFLTDPDAYCAGAVQDGGISIEVVESDVPMGGYMYQTMKGDIVSGGDPGRMVYDALYNSTLRYALDGGADETQAQTIAKQLAEDSKARARYRNLLYCGLFNDLYYGTYGYDAKFGAGGPNGRRFRNLPQHEDNRTRILMGLTPLRRMALGTPADKGKGNISAKFGKLPYLSFPLLDREALLNPNLPIDLRIRYGTWADGSTGSLPHPSIQSIMSRSGLPPATYGCTGAGYVWETVP